MFNAERLCGYLEPETTRAGWTSFLISAYVGLLDPSILQLQWVSVDFKISVPEGRSKSLRLHCDVGEWANSASLLRMTLPDLIKSWNTKHSKCCDEACAIELYRTACRCLQDLWHCRKAIAETARVTHSWRAATQRLMQVSGFGGTGFLAEELVQDLIHTLYSHSGIQPTTPGLWLALI